MSAQAQQFQQMLAIDAKNYALLIKWRALLDAKEKAANAIGDRAALRALAPEVRQWGDFAYKYYKRQGDYRTNTAYKISQWLTDAGDSLTQAVKNWWDRISGGFNGLGAVPLLVPVVIAAGAVLTVAVIGYFVSRYYAQTTLDYDALTDKVAEIAKTDPALAKQILAQAGMIQNTQSETSLQKLAGSMGWALAAGGAFVAYRLAVNHKIIKPINLGGARRRR